MAPKLGAHGSDFINSVGGADDDQTWWLKLVQGAQAVELADYPLQ